VGRAASRDERQDLAADERARLRLQIQLRDGRKFEELARYGCANLFFLVVPDDLRKPEPPIGWGLLVAQEGALKLQRKPTWHDSPEFIRLRARAAAGTQFNRRHARHPSCSPLVA
jgi:hypothetical protein